MRKRLLAEVLSLPNPFHRSNLGKERQDVSQQLVTIGSCAAPLELSKEQAEKLVASIDDCPDYKETDQQYRVYERPLDIDEMILDIALAEENLCVVDHYFKRTSILADIDVRVVRPAPPEDIRGLSEGLSSSAWHRDIRGRQIKIMYYLTDVRPGETCFEYIPSTHWKRTYDYNESRIPCIAPEHGKARPRYWASPKGQGMIFDTNLIHRLRRSTIGTPRYSVTFYYTPGQSIMPYEMARTSAFDKIGTASRYRLKGLNLAG